MTYGPPRGRQIEDELAILFRTTACSSCALADVASNTSDVLVDVGATLGPPVFMVANIPRRRARASPSESGSTPDHGAHLEHLSLQHDLDHQIGSDISRSNDPTFNFALLVLPKGTGCGPIALLTSERGPCQYRRFGFVFLVLLRPTIGPNAPVSTTSRLEAAHRRWPASDQPEGGLQRMTEAGGFSISNAPVPATPFASSATSSADQPA